MPYIYVPEADFSLIKTRIDKMFSIFKDLEHRPYICDATEGNCYMENSCDYTRSKMNTPYGMTLTLSDGKGKDFVIEVSESQMLRDVNNVIPTSNKACFLPFYTNRKTQPNTWVVGSLVMNNYYTVYDLTPSDGSLSFGIAPKNPKFGEDVHPVDPPTPLKDHKAALIAVVLTMLILGLFAFCLYRKHKREMDSTVVFETYKEYDFGQLKKGDKSHLTTSQKIMMQGQVNYSGKGLASSNENSSRGYDSSIGNLN